MKKGARIFVMTSLVLFLLFMLVLPFAFSVGESSVKDSLLDSDFQRGIRGADSVRVSNGGVGDLMRLKSYDASEKTLTIEGGGFDTLVKIKLISDYNAHVGVGNDVKVAELLLIDWKNDKVNLFDVLNFYDVKDRYSDVSKVFVLKYAVDSVSTRCYDVEKFDVVTNVSLGFESVCSDVSETNWVEFSLLSELPNKNIKVGIFTDTVLGEEIEWVPTIEGFEVMEWASYLVDGLVSYYKMDEEDTSGSGTIIDSLASNNGTNNGTSNVTGKIKTGYEFDGVDDYIDTGVILPTNNVSISFWMKTNSRTGSATPLGNSVDGTGADDGIQAFFSSTTNLQFVRRGITGAAVNLPVTDDSNWYHIILVASTEGLFGYVDGSLADSCVTTVCKDEFNNGVAFTQGLVFGGFYFNSGLVNDFNGTIDEIGIWNIALNSTAVSDLYNNASGLTYPFADSISPTWSNNKTNASSSTKNGDSVSFNITLADNSDPGDYIFSFYNGTTWVNDSSVSWVNNTEVEVVKSISGVKNQTIQWYWWFNDSSGNSNVTDTWSFVVGNAPPVAPVQLLPANASSYAMNATVTFVWNNSVDIDPDSPTITYDLEIYNESDMAAANLIHSNTSITEGTDNTSISITLSDYTTVDDDYYWRVRANDSDDVGAWSGTREFQYANWTITFNLTDSFDGIQVDTSGGNVDFDISCNNGFSATNVENPHISTDTFAPGTWECTFSGLVSGSINYFDTTLNITADSDKTVEISMQAKDSLTSEEHTWLEAIYNCINGGNCALYNLLLEVNNTVNNIWNHTAPTDESVVLSEVITNKVVNSTNNLTIDYSIFIPIKVGYSVGDYLPVRIGYFFLDSTNTSCYDQGDVQADVNGPSCSPLIIETIGPMGGTVNFTVELQPALVSGDNYTIKRVIDIDPLGVWYNYGSEIIGDFTMMETLSVSGAGVERTSDEMPEVDSSGEDNDGSDSGSGSSSGGSSSSTDSTSSSIVTNENNVVSPVSGDKEETTGLVSTITGAVVGAGENLLSGSQLVLIFAMLCVTLIVVVFNRSRTKLKISGH